MRDEVCRCGSVIQHLPDLLQLLWRWGYKYQASSPQPIWETCHLNFHSSNQHRYSTSFVPGPSWGQVISQYELRRRKRNLNIIQEHREGVCGRPDDEQKGAHAIFGVQ